MDMDRYLKKILTLVQMCRQLTELSTCKRLNTSAAIFPTDCSAIYALGYNGPARGLPNDSCTGEEGRCGCSHAEANAIAKFNNDIAKPSLLFTVHWPCPYCAALLLNCSKIIGVLYQYEYRDDKGRELLVKADMIMLNVSDLQVDTHASLLRKWRVQC